MLSGWGGHTSLKLWPGRDENKRDSNSVEVSMKKPWELLRLLRAVKLTSFFYVYGGGKGKKDKKSHQKKIKNGQKRGVCREKEKKEKHTGALPKRLLSSFTLSRLITVDMLSFVHKLIRGKKSAIKTSGVSRNSRYTTCVIQKK